MSAKWLFLVGEIVLTTALAVVVGLWGDPVVWAFVVWLGFTKIYTAWYLTQQIDQINSRLGFGVSVPLHEMPRVMDQITSRIHQSTASPVTTADVSTPKPGRKRRGLLDELTDLEHETPPRA